jgi:GT2 family glycosyltransferase
MNPCLILTRNCLDLTDRCVTSVCTQDTPASILFVDNGSTDGTFGKYGSWAMDAFSENKGVSFGWNHGLKKLFSLDINHVLVLNNDVILPPYFYRELLAYNLPFVTGASVDCVEALQNKGPFSQAYPGPDFSAFLIRRDAWEKIGPFDENMVHYCGDCDYHVRATKAGVELLNSGVPFYHERSSTLKHASDEDREAIQIQAELDRAAFKAKYGCLPWEPAYADLFK